jgi:hypothetical protein
MKVSRSIACSMLFALTLSTSSVLADEKPIPVEDLPKLVLKVAQKAFPEAQVVGAKMEKFGEDSAAYIVEMKLGDKSILMQIDDEGESMGVAKEIEAGDLPGAVIRALARFHPMSRIAKVEEVSYEDEVDYRVTLALEGKKPEEVFFSPNGAVQGDNDDLERPSGVQKEIETEDLPKAVTRAVGRFFPKGTITQVVEISDEDDEVIYKLTLAVQGKEPVDVFFSPNGTILEDLDGEDDEDKGDNKAERVRKPAP